MNQNNDNDQNKNSALFITGHSAFFEIRVKGHLDDSWSDWLEGLNIERLDDGEMLLSGTIVDQSALMGVLNTLGRLNMALISLNEKNPKENK